MEPQAPRPDWYTKLPLASLIRAASAHQVDPYLLAGICQQESRGDTWAVRYEPTIEGEVVKAGFYPKLALSLGLSLETEKALEMCSFGVCQVLGLTARRLGYARQLTQLCDPAFGLEYGAMLLERLLKQYGNEVSAIAAYNAGSPRMTSSGALANQSYVDSVCRYVSELRSPGFTLKG